MNENQDKDRIICRCEEIMESEIRQAVEEGCTTVKEIKRRTRAGMGYCQGSTCSLLIKRIICDMTKKEMGELTGDTARFPAYPVKIEELSGEQK